MIKVIPMIMNHLLFNIAAKLFTLTIAFQNSRLNSSCRDNARSVTVARFKDIRTYVRIMYLRVVRVRAFPKRLMRACVCVRSRES